MSRVVSVFMLLALVLSVDSRHSRMLFGSSSSGEESTATCNALNCGADDSCKGDTVDITVCSDSFTAECTGKRSCQDAVITIDSDGHDIEYFAKCDNDDSCNGAEFTIDCGGKKLKGVSCNGLRGCMGAKFTITDCEVEKFECNANKACYGADITFDSGSTVDAFVCNGWKACDDDPNGDNFSCTGVSECP
eukprot:169804_1